MQQRLYMRASDYEMVYKNCFLDMPEIQYQGVRKYYNTRVEGRYEGRK